MNYPQLDILGTVDCLHVEIYFSLKTSRYTWVKSPIPRGYNNLIHMTAPGNGGENQLKVE